MDPKLIQQALDALEAGDATKALEILKALIASAAGADPGPGDATPGAPDAPMPADMSALSAALKELLVLTGKASVGEALAAVRGVFADVQASRDRQAALDNDSRLELVGELVKLGVEFPITAWEGDPKDRKPVARLASEPLDSLRTRVGLLQKARPASRNVDPATVEGDVAKLSADDRAKADKIKDPAQRARFIQLRLSRSGK